MSKGLIEKETLTSIADAIREKSSGEETYLPSQMAEAIRTLPSKGQGFSQMVKITVPTSALSGYKRIIDCSPYVDFSTDECILIGGNANGGNWQGIVLFVNGQLDNWEAQDTDNHNTSCYEVEWTVAQQGRSVIDKEASTVAMPDTNKNYGSPGAWNVVLVY